MTILELQEQLTENYEQSLTITNRCEAEKRDPSEDENSELDLLGSQFDEKKTNLDRLLALEKRGEDLRQSLGRKSEPEDPSGGEPAPEPVRNLRPGGAVGDHLSFPLEDKSKWGWRHLGEYAKSVVLASAKGGPVDQKLINQGSQLAPTTWSSEASGTDGGFAVPPDFRATIMEKVMGEDSLLARTDQQTSSSNNFTIPVDETTPWQTSGGIQAFWQGESSQLTQSKISLEQRTLILHKLTALVPATDELIEDATSLANYLNRKAPDKLRFKLNLAILQGDGAGKPLGILPAPGTVSVAKQGSQLADTLVANNILKMWSRMYAPWRPGAVWLINQDIEPQLNKLSIPGTDDTGAAVTTWGIPVYVPAGGFSQQPFATLMNRPVIATQACETLGDKGDIILANLNEYLSVQKTTGIRADTSIHLFFDYDITAFRFIMRVAGQPWMSAAISPRDGSNTLSAFVTLDERA